MFEDYSFGYNDLGDLGFSDFDYSGLNSGTNLDPFLSGGPRSFDDGPGIWQTASDNAGSGSNWSWLQDMFKKDPGGTINRFLSGGMGLYDMFGKGSLSAGGIRREAADAADPFRHERDQYKGLLQGYMMDPGSYSLSPAAQFQLNTGTENLTRSMAAKGMLGSGNILGELMRYGQGVASTDYWKAIDELGLLSGARTGSPEAAGRILGDAYGQRNNAAANVGGAVGSGGGGSDTLGSIAKIAGTVLPFFL